MIRCTNIKKKRFCWKHFFFNYSSCSVFLNNFNRNISVLYINEFIYKFGLCRVLTVSLQARTRNWWKAIIILLFFPTFYFFKSRFLSCENKIEKLPFDCRTSVEWMDEKLTENSVQFYIIFLHNKISLSIRRNYFSKQ